MAAAIVGLLATGGSTNHTIHLVAIARAAGVVRLRPIRPVEYRLSAGFPAHFVRETFEAVGQWNESLMRGRRAIDPRSGRGATLAQRRLSA